MANKTIAPNRMRPYLDKEGRSGVEFYRLSRHFVDIQFRGTSKIYRYNITDIGVKYFEMMKTAARLGSHLNRVINLIKQM